jgi:tripartite-type tricarboxylate transporter receptor subunit TctC
MKNEPNRPRRTAVRTASLAVAALALCAAATGWAQSAWPSKPIRWVVPYTAGGGTDQSSRIIAEKLSAALGQPIVIDNRPGGNTIIGASIVASAPPDGYTVFFAALSTMAVIPNLYDKLPYAPDALTPVTQLVHYPLFLMVQANGPLDTMPKFAAAARSKPLLFAIGGSGSGGHLGSELLKRQLKADMTAVPFKAMVQAAPEVATGRVSFMFADLPAALPHVQGGRATIIATAGKTRSALYPDAPTLAESGLGDIDFDTWAGLAVPKGTPQPIVGRLATELNKVIADPAVRKKLAVIGVEPAPSSQAQFTSFIAAENTKWRAVIQAADIKIE